MVRWWALAYVVKKPLVIIRCSEFLDQLLDCGLLMDCVQWS